MATRSSMKAQAEAIADRDEILGLLTGAARKGHVGAMRLLLEELRRDGGDETAAPASVIDELASKRKAIG